MPLPAPTQSFDEVDEAEARRRYEAAWEQGGVLVLQQFNDLLDQPATRTSSPPSSSARRSASIVDDPDIADKLTPIGYPIAAKRPVLDTNYFETFNQPHVHLVDVSETPITEITPTGITHRLTLEHELDVIIFATGYDAFTGSFLRIDIRGRERCSARRSSGPTGRRPTSGSGIAGFPNLLTVNGPCSPAVLTNVPATIEHDVEWIADCVDYLEAATASTSIEPTEEAEQAWVRHIADAGRRHAVPARRLVVDGRQHPRQAARVHGLHRWV